MESITLEKEIIEAIRLMNIEQQTKLLEFIYTFVRPIKPTVNVTVLEFAGRISSDEANEMARDIDETFGKIDFDEW